VAFTFLRNATVVEDEGLMGKEKHRRSGAACAPPLIHTYIHTYIWECVIQGTAAAHINSSGTMLPLIMEVLAAVGIHFT
jgi:hypothetical protein